ncbi:MAG: ribonuclease P protein component [Bifidobacteriaceae bacterium]|nr:ribonuclease P protein component [Bifidobacteriaceae bacterium]
MLPKRRRVRRSDDFAAVIRGGRRGGSRLVVVYAAPAPDGAWKAGFIVSKAVGDSVERHRVTRRLRAIAAARLPDVAPPRHVVVRALKGSASCAYRELDDAVRAGLAKAAR